MVRDRESQNPLVRIESKVDEALEWIKGTNDSPGAKERIDRLENAMSIAKWLIGTCIAGLLTAVAGMLIKR